MDEMDADMKTMVMGFRVMDLQNLLSFAKKNNLGRKKELQARCLELIKIRSFEIAIKIMELYESIPVANMATPHSSSTSNSSSNANNYNSATAARPSIAPQQLYNSGFDNDSFEMMQQEDNQYSLGCSHPHQRMLTMDGQYRSFPICSDVVMKELPFYDTQAVLLKPIGLLSQGQNCKHEITHTFSLTPSQASQISDSRQAIVGEDAITLKIQHNIQVLLRICALDGSKEPDDFFPPNLHVKVNGRPVQLPSPIPSTRVGEKSKQPSRPLNITTNLKFCSVTNSVTVQWISDLNNYAMQVTMVSKLNAEELLRRLKSKRIQPSDFTRGRIKEITSTEEEDLCAPTSLRVTVACPLSKSRMTYPCRASTCKHLQCFDANAFLLMNEKRPSFMCPVCNEHLKFDDLQIDGYFMDVIQKLSLKDDNDIELFPNGTWEPVIRVQTKIKDTSPSLIKVKSDIEGICPPAKRIKFEIEDSRISSTIDLDDDDDDICIVNEDNEVTSSSNDASAKSKADEKKEDPEVIDLIDSSDEEEELVTTEHPLETEAAFSPAPPEEESESEEEIEIRPRRRFPRFVESSSDSSDSPRAPPSPAYIELSDYDDEEGFWID